MASKDTLKEYNFDKWVPLHTQEMILKFWNQHGGANEWRGESKIQGESEFSHHGPNPNGFQLPPYGALCEFFRIDYELSKAAEKEVFISIKGRYVHRWNNMGSLIDKDGNDHTVSTCDRWVRWFIDDDDRAKTLAMFKGNN